MVQTVKELVGTRTSLAYTSTQLSTLASATYVQNTTAYDCSTNSPSDVAVEVVLATTNTPAGNKQAVVFISYTLDGTNYTSGPTSGTTTTDEPDHTNMGPVPMNTATTTHRRIFSVKQACGLMPLKFFIVIKNDLGVALTSGTVFTSEISKTLN